MLPDSIKILIFSITTVLRITITITNVRYNFYNPGGGPDGGMPIGGGPEGGGPGGGAVSGGAVSGGAVSGGGLLGGAKWGGGDRLVEGKLGGGGPLGSCKSMCVELTFRKGRRWALDGGKEAAEAVGASSVGVNGGGGGKDFFCLSSSCCRSKCK